MHFTLLTVCLFSPDVVLPEVRSSTLRVLQDPLRYINPEDIESMSVLTRVAAAALYGSEAANGAIVITTKKGKEGKVSLTCQQQYRIHQSVCDAELPKPLCNGTGGVMSTSGAMSWGYLLVRCQ